MATTTISSYDTMTGKLWAEKFFRKMGFETVVDKLMVQGDNGIISVKRELEKADGDRVRFHIFNELGGEFVRGSTSLEGQEQKLTHAYQDVILEEYKLGVRVKNGIDMKRAIFPISKIAEERLKLQVAKNIDKLWFEKMFEGTLTKQLYSGSATSLATLAETDVLSLESCSKAKYGAMSGWQSVSQTVNLEPFRPVRIDGGEYFVVLTHPYAVYSLVNSASYQLLMRDAMERGKTNPIFTGAVAILDNVIIKTSNFVPLQTTVNGITYAKSLFLGAQASCWAWGQQMEVINKAFGYNEEEGWGARLIMQPTRTRFTNSLPASTTDVPPSNSTYDYACAQFNIACPNLGA
jgi:N4-gp56 family major capsid protein